MYLEFPSQTVQQNATAAAQLNAGFLEAFAGEVFFDLHFGSILATTSQKIN